MLPPNVTRRNLLAGIAGGIVGSAGVVGADRGESVGYERRYEPMTDLPVDVGAVYIPFLDSKWGECIDHDPAAGQYAMTDSEAINRHVDQMQGFGISTLLYNYSPILEDSEFREQFHAFTEAELVAEIDLQPYSDVLNAFRWHLDEDFRELMRRHCRYIREDFFARDNHDTIDGRPVVTFWDVDSIAWLGNETQREVKDQIIEEWGGFAELISFLRAELAVEGTDPYLVADVHDHTTRGLSADYEEINSQFDAVTNWTGVLRNGKTTPWSDAKSHMADVYLANAEFADEHGQGHIPTVFPGFNDVTNDCVDGDRIVPRDPSHLTDLLRMGEEYETADRVFLATFNGWPEGHQVEPGTYDGTDYGTSYLEAIRADMERRLREATSTPTPGPTPSPTAQPEPRTPTATASSAADEETTRTEGPGFGAAATLAGVGVAASRLAGRRGSESEPE